MAESTRPLFVAVGHNGLRLASDDGVDWKNLQTGKEGETYRAVQFGNGRFVTVGTYGGENIFASSADGATWKTGRKEAKYVKYFRGLGFGREMFLGLGGDPGSVGSSSPFVLTSRDGVEWSDFISIPGKHILRRVAFGNGLFVGVGDRGRRALSADGKDWKEAPGTKAIETLVDVAFGNGVFVGVGLHGLRATTQNGVKWSEARRGEEGEHLNSIVWAGDRFVAVGAGATYFSADGADWKREPNQDAPLVLAHGNRIFIGANWKGRLLKSSDGIEWKQVFKAGHHIEAVTFGTLPATP